MRIPSGLKDQMKMVFEHYPDRYYQASDFNKVHPDLFTVARAYGYCEELWAEKFVKKEERCDEGTVLCGDGPHDSYYKLDDGEGDDEITIDEILSQKAEEASKTFRTDLPNPEQLVQEVTL